MGWIFVAAKKKVREVGLEGGRGKGEEGRREGAGGNEKTNLQDRQ